MFKLKIIIPVLLIAIVGCSQKVHNSGIGNISKKPGDSLFVTLAMKNLIQAGEKINLRFVVHNNNSMGKSFCKWHTPFEPLMSNYLDIKDENGKEAVYKGPVAKRIMPPISDNYLFVNPKDTLVSIIDLSKGYQFEAGKKYTISYNSSIISGIKSSNTASFIMQQ
ncbi:protease [Pedobacter lithocola]|uniref:Protease n=1 Tax=Pedobacter lithocola TaxID=1908239 RepID=A0ABV8PAT6_9SPHI